MDIWFQLRLSDRHSQQHCRGHDPVGSFPVGIAITPNGAFAYVANLNSNSVSVINTATNTVTATIMAGTGPYGLAITPDGAFAYVTNLNSNDVSVISTATNTVVATVPVGSGPVAVAITPNGAFAYVTNQSSNNVSVIEPLPTPWWPQCQ